jgi:hypothetical protein
MALETHFYKDSISSPERIQPCQNTLIEDLDEISDLNVIRLENAEKSLGILVMLVGNTS